MRRARKRTYGDGSIYEDPKTGGYIAQLYIDGKPIRRRAPDRSAAEAVLSDLRQQRDGRVDMQGGAQSVEAFATIWYTEVLSHKGLKPNTLLFYKNTLELYLLPHLGRARLDAVTPRDVQRFLNTLRTRTSIKGVPLSSGTLNHAYTVGDALFEQARRWKYVRENPFADVDRPALIVAEKRPMTIEETWRLFNATAAHRFAALFRIKAILGPRTGEVLGLRWADVDMTQRTLTIAQQLQQRTGDGAVFQSPKSDAGLRTLPLTDDLIAHLRAHWRVQQEERALLGVAWKEHGLVFPNERGGPLLPSNLRSRFGIIRAPLGLSAIGLHQLRHTAATRLAETGATELLIAAILGHAPRGITGHYVHVSTAAMREAVERAEAMVLRAAPTTQPHTQPHTDKTG